MVFILTVWVLLSKRPQRQPAQDPMLWITVLMFAMATLVRTCHLGHPHAALIQSLYLTVTSDRLSISA